MNAMDHAVIMELGAARYTILQLQTALKQLQDRIAELESQSASTDSNVTRIADAKIG